MQQNIRTTIRNAEEDLSHYPLLGDKEDNISDDESLNKQVIDLFLASLPEEIGQLKQAYSQKNWPQVDFLVNRLRGESLYLNAKRLKKACEQFKQCPKASSEMLTGLYEQLLTVIDESVKSLRKIS